MKGLGKKRFGGGDLYLSFSRGAKYEDKGEIDQHLDAHKLLLVAGALTDGKRYALIMPDIGMAGTSLHGVDNF